MSGQERTGRKRKEIPYELARLAKRRSFRNVREAQAWFANKGFKVSIGWLSINKDRWTPTRKEQMTANYVEEDKTFDSDLAQRIMHRKGITPDQLTETIHFTTEEIDAFSKEKSVACCKAFCERCLSWKGKPVILQDYQERMIEGWLKKQATIYPMGRGCGKDFTLALFLIWLTVCFPNTRVMVVCPAQRQVKTFINENLHIMMQTSGVVYDSVAKYIEEEFWTTSNSVIFTYGATSFIKGKHNLEYIFANEAAEIPDQVYDNVLMPMLGTASEGGHFCLLGVPNGQQGFFWQSFLASTQDINEDIDPLNEKARNKFFCINLPTSVNKYYSKEQLALNKSVMSEDAYLQEHEAQFLDIEGALFNAELIQKMKIEYEQYFGIVDHSKFEYFLGIDWGRISDYSVFTIIELDKQTKVAKVAYIEANRKKFPDQLDWVESADKIYKFKIIRPEKMGIGIPPTEELVDRLGSSKVKPFIPSAGEWFDAFSRTRDMAVNDKLKIPAGEQRLSRQLRLMAFDIKGGQLTVRSEGKDDFAQSFAIACSAIKKTSGSGVAGSL